MGLFIAYVHLGLFLIRVLAPLTPGSRSMSFKYMRKLFTVNSFGALGGIISKRV